jgi:hypothetical protein
LTAPKRRTITIQAELSAVREMLVEIIAKEGKEDCEAIQRRILLNTARRANNMLASTADHYPGGVTPYSALLDVWKKQRKI